MPEVYQSHKTCKVQLRECRGWPWIVQSKSFQTQPFAALQHKEDWAKVQGKTCDRLQHVPKKPGGAAPSSERADALSGKAILVAFTG